MKVSFVIPSYNHPELINQLLCDIRDNCTPDEIIVVDDCSTDPKAIDMLKWWAENYGVKVFNTTENIGFLKASNYGIGYQAKGDIACLISTDVRVEDDLAKIVKDLLDTNPKRLIGGVVYTHNTGWNQFGGRIFSYAEGWLLACTKEAWVDLDGFDERYMPSDYEDLDLSTTAISKGYELYSLNNPSFRHTGGQSYGYTAERRERTERNRKLFEEKWIK